MNIDAEKWFEDWRAKDRQAILAANPTIDMLIRELQHYRLYYATHQACRKAGGLLEPLCLSHEMHIWPTQ